MTPVSIGLVLAAFGICWILVAALVSLFWPASDSPAVAPATEPLEDVRRRVDRLTGELALRLKLLETGPKPQPAEPPKTAFVFDQKLSFLKAEVEGLRRSLAATVFWDTARTDLTGRLDEMTRRAEGLLQTSERAEARPAPAPGEAVSFADIYKASTTPPAAAPAPSWQDDLRDFLADVRRERGQIMERQKEGALEFRRRRDELVSEADRLKADASRTGAEAARLQEGRETLAQEAARLAARQEALRREQASAPPADPAEPAAEANRRLRAGLEAERAAMEAQRAARDRREKVLRRRLERWRRGWERRLAESGSAIETELNAMTAANAAAREALARQRAETDAAVAALEKERARLETERASFQTEVEEPWRLARSESERRLAGLKDENVLLEREVRTLEEKRREEQAGFERNWAAEKRAVREKQSQWKQDLQIRRLEGERQRSLAAAEAEAARRDLERERASAARQLEERRLDLARAEESAERARAAFEDQAMAEKERLNAALGEAGARLREARESHEKLKAAFEEETRKRAALRAEHREWARRRMENLGTVLETVQKDASLRLADVREERAALQKILLQEREKFVSAQRALDEDFETKRRALENARRVSEAGHAAFVAGATADEQEGRRGAAELTRAVEEMEKKVAEYRLQTERRVQKQRESYEAVLLRMEQRISQDQVAAESRLAQEKLTLESFTRRVAGRQTRVEKALARRRTALDQLYEEARLSLELVQQGQWREKREWSLRLDEIRKQQAALEEARARSAEGMDPQLYDKRKRELTEAFEAEKSRLTKEAEDYWKSFLEKSAANQDGLRGAMAALEGAGKDLESQEAAANEIVAAVKNQIAHLKALQDRFRVREQRSGDVSISETA